MHFTLPCYTLLYPAVLSQHNDPPRPFVHQQAVDDEFGGSPVQVREVQGEESAEFKALWKGGLNFKQGPTELQCRL